MSAPGYGLHDGQLEATQAREILAAPGADVAQGAHASAHAILAVHAELAALRALAEDTVQRVMGSRPGVQVTRTNAAGFRVTENLTADRLGTEARIAAAERHRAGVFGVPPGRERG